MALPPFVIVHGKRTNGVDAKGHPVPVFLGIAAWTLQRNEAVSCTTLEEAQSWLEASRKETPKLFAGAEPRAERCEHKPGQEAPGTIAHEYDPYNAQDFA